mmetsp:Transcript_30241/g.83171  ORF Transcript_30241/g.83171 Transcript_30241/m.83171 type:complete len:122 (+) Transcript_30241:1-366(+)
MPPIAALACGSTLRKGVCLGLGAMRRIDAPRRRRLREPGGTRRGLAAATVVLLGIVLVGLQCLIRGDTSSKSFVTPAALRSPTGRPSFTIASAGASAAAPGDKLVEAAGAGDAAKVGELLA